VVGVVVRATELLSRIFSVIPGVVLWAGLFTWTMAGERVGRSLYLTIQELLATAVLAQVVLYKKTLFAAFFRSRVLRYFGAISYSLISASNYL